MKEEKDLITQNEKSINKRKTEKCLATLLNKMSMPHQQIRRKNRLENQLRLVK